MIFEEMLREERAEGRAEGKVEGTAGALFVSLEELGEIPEVVRKRIMNEKDLETLTRWLRLAVKADSLEGFLNNM